MNEPRVRALVLQHLPVEHPGSVGRHLTRAGVEMVTTELDHGQAIPDLEPFDLMVVMGGPMDVWEEDAHPWLADEKLAIRAWVESARGPFLGVCLGHQLLAASLGGEVGPMGAPEVGVVPIELGPPAATDPVFARLGPRFYGLEWHGAEVTRLPDGAELLASTPACAVQAFRMGASAWGLQFHVEAGPTTVAEWCTVPEYRESLARSSLDAAVLDAAVAERQATMDQVAAELVAGLLAAVRRVAGRDRSLSDR